MCPNTILITHEFEPLVGDFGLARWQPGGNLGLDTRVIGTFGYLAPEHAQSDEITEKADVYSFGVVLVAKLLTSTDPRASSALLTGMKQKNLSNIYPTTRKPIIRGSHTVKLRHALCWKTMLLRSWSLFSTRGLLMLHAAALSIAETLMQGLASQVRGPATLVLTNSDEVNANLLLFWYFA